MYFYNQEQGNLNVLNSRKHKPMPLYYCLISYGILVYLELTYCYK